MFSVNGNVNVAVVQAAAAITTVLLQRGPGNRSKLGTGRNYPTFRAANVASLPKYSPFRYPGGKTWLIPQIREWLANRKKRVLVEPFAGGATASLVGVLEGYVERAVLVERDCGVAAVWKTILSPDCEWLIERILTFPFSSKSVHRVLNEVPQSSRDLAFLTLLLNRVRSGGILSNSARLIRNGERGKGLSSRWYPETISLRIANIHSAKERFQVKHGDGLREIRHYATERQACFFVDPPYVLSNRVRPLYHHSEIDHPALFALLYASRRDFLLTYRDSRRIRDWVDLLGLKARRVVIRGNGGRKSSELLLQSCDSYLPFLGSLSSNSS